MFTCPLCAKTFGTQHVLKSHIFTHTKEKPHKCLTCSETFGYLASLNKHVQTIHDGIKLQSFQCHVCGHKSTGKGNLKQHLMKHSTELPISCTMPSCSFKTKSHRQLKAHVRRVHLREAPYSCKIVGCNYKTSVAGNLNRHLKVHSNEKPFACQVPGCDYTCKEKPYLTSHINSVHKNEKPWKCSICGFQTKLRSILNRHRGTHSSNKRFQCQSANCRYASNSKKSLIMHFDRKHRKKEILCTEPRCKYRCGSTAILKIHLKDHELPIMKCPVDSCNYSTRLKRDLLAHTSRNHGDEQCTSLLLSGKRNSENSGPTVAVVETRNCPFPSCGYQTDFPHRYDRHIMSHHDQEKQRKYACKFCPSRFTLLSGLEAHIQRHLGEKPYKCPHCDYTAIDSWNLRCHAQRIHRIYVIPRGLGTENQFERKCRTCNLTSWSYSEFILHSVTHLRPVVMLERLRVHDV